MPVVKKNNEFGGLIFHKTKITIQLHPILDFKLFNCDLYLAFIL